ncbi:uncharacterized protein [Anabrus simplex]|uniref:uncharacterized protein n=1 Tax=Anabrus simplex TaxID=316456 RepID=UPI0035A2979A
MTVPSCTWYHGVNIVLNLLLSSVSPSLTGSIVTSPSSSFNITDLGPMSVRSRELSSDYQENYSSGSKQDIPWTNILHYKLSYLSNPKDILDNAQIVDGVVRMKPFSNVPIKFRDYQHLLEILQHTYDRSKSSFTSENPQNVHFNINKDQILNDNKPVKFQYDQRKNRRIKRSEHQVSSHQQTKRRVDANGSKENSHSNKNINNNRTDSSNFRQNTTVVSNVEEEKEIANTSSVASSASLSLNESRTGTKGFLKGTAEGTSDKTDSINDFHGLPPTSADTSHHSSNTGRLQKVLEAMQQVADAFLEVPRQLWLLPIRFGFYPGLQRTQDEIPTLVKFPCRQNKSSSPPTSVHRLRPGDVKVIGALGDSLTAANGAMAYSEEETRLNYRGVSAMAGGQGNWRMYLTLPNILKEFNPKLLGYALGALDASSPISGLNVAQNGALDDELLYQAKFLVRKMKADSYIDIQNDWKVLNILIGGNDLCNEYCYTESDKDSPEGHRKQLENTLDFLQRNLPRTFVNLIHIPNLTLLRNMKNIPFVCYMKQLVLCSCLFGGTERAKLESVSRILEGYWEVERKVAENPRYDTDNFTVVLQPFFLGVDSPDNVNTWFGEAPDLSFFAPDCFHFSQKGNSLIANALWNNMLEPVGHKTFGWSPLMERFLCPTENAPFLFTRRNSISFSETGKQ